MAECAGQEKQINRIYYKEKDFTLAEVAYYPNGGRSCFYTCDDTALIVDHDICFKDRNTEVFNYSLITDKQNSYMNRYQKVYRLLAEDILKKEKADDIQLPARNTADRNDIADSSPLELLFEQNFSNVYGISSLKYLQKEYGITDRRGNNYYLDYLVQTSSGKIAIEENGITYHHPQIIGIDRYRRQLEKQNACADWGIKLFRFSTEDCRFEERIEDDIKTYFGKDTSVFQEKGLVLERKVELYDHQKDTLARIQQQRKQGIHSFLVVFPTASGKSKIVEEDLKIYASERDDFKALILAPNINIVEDWKKRIDETLHSVKDRIEIKTFSWMMLHYTEYDKAAWSYIVVDEAHHAVAPVLKRVIQYFNPDFLIGLTATDQRPDRKKLEDVFGNYETGLSLVQAMQDGIVAQANVYRIETNLDLSNVRINGRDYVNADLEKKVRVSSRNELIADVIKEYFTGSGMDEKQGVIFCVNTSHTTEMARLLNESGITAAAYSSREKNPDKIMDDFRSHKYRFLCACNMISEGWDYPELEILVMARPTLSKVLYLQQIGRGLRRTDRKKNVFVVDVVDEYGAMARPCSMHAVFANTLYVPFGNILKRDYRVGDLITVDGLAEWVENIVPVDIATFEDKYGDYLTDEQLARDFFVSTGSVRNWIKNGKIVPTEKIVFGKKTINLFSPEDAARIRKELGIKEHTDVTVKQDFFEFLEERDYTLSYKMPFMLSLLDNLDTIGDAYIDSVLEGYTAFYADRLERGLTVDRSTCPYTPEFLKDKKKVRQNMLTNPFEKFERKRFMYYSKELGKISLNHVLFENLTPDDMDKIRTQMKEDLNNYYKDMGGI